MASRSVSRRALCLFFSQFRSRIQGPDVSRADRGVENGKKASIHRSNQRARAGSFFFVPFLPSPFVCRRRERPSKQRQSAGKDRREACFLFSFFSFFLLHLYPVFFSRFSRYTHTPSFRLFMYFLFIEIQFNSSILSNKRKRKPL